MSADIDDSIDDDKNGDSDIDNDENYKLVPIIMVDEDATIYVLSITISIYPIDIYYYLFTGVLNKTG